MISRELSSVMEDMNSNRKGNSTRIITTVIMMQAAASKYLSCFDLIIICTS